MVDADGALNILQGLKINSVLVTATAAQINAAAGAAPLSTVTNRTAGQIRALFSAPVQVIPAPGAGKIIVPKFTYTVFTFGTKPYGPIANDGGTNFAYGGQPNLFVGGPTGPAYAAERSLLTGGPLFLPSGLTPPINQGLFVTTLNGDLSAGEITASTLGAGGLSYAVGDTGTISSGDGNATYVVTSVDGSGAITGYTLTNLGSGYAVGTGISTAVGGAQPGGGTDFSINIGSIQPGDGTAQVTVEYEVVTVS